MALGGEHGRINQHTVALNAVQGFAAVNFQLVDEVEFVIALNLRPQCQMHVQCLVGIFASVFAGFVYVHLIKTYLIGALAAQVFKAQSRATHVAQRQAGQTVWFVHFQHIALQHGVVGIALYFNAVVGKHMAVIFDVLTQFFVRGVFQPRFQFGQYLVAWQLNGCIRVAVRQWNVGGSANAGAQTNTDNFGAHFVERCGFGVNSHQIGCQHFGKPCVKLLPCQHGFVHQGGNFG